MRSAFPIEIQPNISHVSPSKSSAGLDDLEGARDRERERKSCREREVILWQIFEPEEEEEGDRRRHWRDETIEKSSRGGWKVSNWNVVVVVEGTNTRPVVHDYFWWPVISPRKKVLFATFCNGLVLLRCASIQWPMLQYFCNGRNVVMVRPGFWVKVDCG